jgi:hypothetical protein
MKIGTWTGSEPPRGSGWVQRSDLQLKRVYDVPTRYREVVLTLSKHRLCFGRIFCGSGGTVLLVTMRPPGR